MMLLGAADSSTFFLRFVWVELHGMLKVVKSIICQGYSSLPMRKFQKKHPAEVGSGEDVYPAQGFVHKAIIHVHPCLGMFLERCSGIIK